MSQKSSVPQAVSFVSQVLKRDKLAVADGARGFSQAIEEVWPQAGWMG